MSKKKKKGLKVALIIIISVLAVLALLYGGVRLALEHYLNKIPRTNTETYETIPPESEDFETDDIGDYTEPVDPSTSDPYSETIEPPVSTDPTDPPDPPDSTNPSSSSETNPPPVTTIPLPRVDPIDDGDLINIMLVGEDRRPDQTTRQRSDTMILCSIDTKTGKVSLISFLRDTYVKIPGGYSNNRLNAAYRFGGFPLMFRTFKQNFGVTVDYGIAVDFSGFKAIIDAIGGVDVDVSAAEAKRFHDYFEGNYWGWLPVEGVNHMDGKQALWYARERHLDGDRYRAERQRKIVIAAFEKIKTSGLSEIVSLFETLAPYLTTDMTNNQIISLITSLAPKMTSMQISSYRVPTDNTGYHAMVRGMAVTVPDLPAIRKLLQQYLPLN